jgi:hypothetical protein
VNAIGFLLGLTYRRAIRAISSATAGRKCLCNPYSYDHGKLVISRRLAL